ncbi:nuclear transport factor 2 family protein [Nostoc ellipsosporum NOK]|nr:nuclear transport factor 2 family protein [Nostoc ellipsosporum NOK]
MTTSQTHDAGQVRELIEQWADAMRRKDTGNWLLFFGASPRPPVFDIVDLAPTARADRAFAFALMRRVVVTKAGSSDLDFRLTICLEKIASQWTFMHDHHSVPAID